MALDSVRVRWVQASGYLNPPQARCGHVAAAVSSPTWGEEFLIVHGGINRHKEALDDLVVLQYEQEAWFQPQGSGGAAALVGPAARAFHSGCVLDRKLYIFGGHVYVKQQHKLHQFNDLWVLNTDTWEWARVDVAPDAVQPCPRDRAAMVALGSSRLLLYGGADAMNRRLDDLWLFDLDLGIWQEVRPTGAKPRPRCCTTLCAVENRVLMFGGDSYGVTNELWSLRGLLEPSPSEASAEGASGGAPGSGPQWIQLTLEGPTPAPRRGHAEASLGRWLVFMGGLTEQKSMLGIKSRNEYLADVVVMDRQVDRVAWKSVEGAAEGEGPLPREKHTLTALSGGRLFLFGGTDGQTTLGDAWWLDLEDIVAPTPHTLLPSELPQGPFALSPSTQEELARQYTEQHQQYALYQQQHQQQQQQAANPPPQPQPYAHHQQPQHQQQQLQQLQYYQQQQQEQQQQQMVTAGGATAAGAGASPLAQQHPSAAQQAQQVVASSAFPYLPASLATSLPGMPAGLSNVFTSFKERFGLPATASQASLAGSAAGAAAAAAGAQQPLGTGAAALSPPPGVGSSAAAGGMATSSAYNWSGMLSTAPLRGLQTVTAAVHDEALLALGQKALLEGAVTGAGEEAVAGGWSPEQLLQAARQFLASCRPEELRLGDLPILMADYRRLARVGWALAVQQQGGLDALLQGGVESAGGNDGAFGAAGGAGDPLLMPGRFLHLSAEELRMREVPEILTDYQLLLLLFNSAGADGQQPDAAGGDTPAVPAHVGGATLATVS